jgi:hypothetical protein|tara:strand:- start:357 stop:971 length:615 start_codon:yes stop_codon:yes gene_type:complete
MKHIGRQINPKRRAVVAYRVVPKEADQCLVVFTDSLEADAHDALMNLVESNAGQTAYELAEAMDRTQLPDGRNMLRAFAATGKFAKMPTNKIEMTPDMKNTVILSELNDAIASQKGVTVEALALQPTDGTPADVSDASITKPAEPVTAAPVAPATTDGVLTDSDLAAQYRSQADRLSKEAAQLRRQAEELVPTKKTSKKSAQSA